MIRLVFILMMVGLVFYAYKKIQAKKATLDKKQILTILSVVLLALCVLMVISGRAHWIAVLAAGVFAVMQRLLPTMVKFLPFLHMQYKKKQATNNSAGNSSQVQSRYLLMTLDHDTGQLDGEVIFGDFQGKHLSELELEDLETLYASMQDDNESLQLLDAYMEKRFGEQWQGGTSSQSGESHQSDAPKSSREEALQILGLQEGASDEEIIQAHRKLIQKLHPDRGGSDYLAARVNEAKKTLLGK